MKRALTAVAIAAGLLACSLSQAQDLPSDVRKFLERRQLCDHFRSEEPYDAERRRFLARKVKQ